MRFVKVTSIEVDASGNLEKPIRVIPSAEASMMEGLSKISDPDERRKAVNRMVGNAKSYSEHVKILTA